MGRAVAAMILMAWFCALVHSQPTAFEVASIQPSALPGRGPIRTGQKGGPGSGDPGRVTYSFSMIRDLIVDAYDVKRNQILGGPNWVDSELFDIVAKVPAGATKEQVKVMLHPSSMPGSRGGFHAGCRCGTEHFHCTTGTARSQVGSEEGTS